MVVRRLVARRAHCRSFSSRCFYETLGVTPGESDASVLKEAYLARARVLHPDVAGPSSDESSFVELQRAYEQLSCPSKRQLYDASRGTGWRSAAADAASCGDAAADQPLWPPPPPPTAAEALVPDPHLRRSFRDALARVYHGPALDMAEVAAGVLPPAFEAEERSEAHPDLLQLVSGRTLLGAVRERVVTSLPAAGVPIAPAGASEHPLAEPHASGSADELWLVTGEGMPMARARRRRIGDPGAGGGDVELFTRCQASGLDTHLCTLLRAPAGGLGIGSLLDGDKRLLGSCVLYATPLVTHLTLLSAAGRVEWRASRAWMPPSSLWLFAPRGASHAAQSGASSWYFEQRLRERRRADLLPPAAIVLVAALHSLDRERGRRAGFGAAVGDAWQRAAGWLSSR